ncbi:helix-turn-helix domain-containing protein [Veronia pacifica]|uniref:HTH cro/C1-type domain-containing protein n=1 Tax=Veronia pacifica TaxID=1080227 RepID=A0A1C3E912_9GAMM|nr:helix-turn-helix transcriptional regulator [Veronia pacifica]ODA29757.1 hypothetical protein A8L45_21765 [Veronia pacifica]
MSQNQAIAMLDALKGALKSKGLTYKELATRCELSEVTIKRLLNRPHISLDQLIQLCSAAETSLSELLWLSENNLSLLSSSMTEEQLTSQLEKPALLEIYGAIISGKRSIKTLAEHFSINLPSAYLYARELEKTKFISLTGNDIELVYPLSTEIDPEGKHELVNLYQQRFLADLKSKLDTLIERGKPEEDDFFFLGMTMLTETENKKYVDDLRELNEKFSKLTMEHIRNPSQDIKIYRRTMAVYEADTPLFPVEDIVDEV